MNGVWLAIIPNYVRLDQICIEIDASSPLFAPIRMCFSGGGSFCDVMNQQKVLQ